MNHDHAHDRGMATAEFTVGTIGAVLMATVLLRLGLLDNDNPWLESLRDILERAFGWEHMHDLLKRVPRVGLRF